MDSVFAAIEQEGERLQQHEFFSLIEAAGTAADVGRLLKCLTSFVFTFQDLVFLNEQRINDPALRAMISRRRLEDAGHSNWFLHDLETLNQKPDLPWLFGEDHAVTRAVSYELLSEVFRATSDGVRLAIPLALENSGTVFFKGVYAFVARSGIKTKFFSATHWEVETQHQEFSDAELQAVKRLDWSDEVTRDALAVVRRMYAAKARMLSDIHQRLSKALLPHAAATTAA